MKLPVSNNGPGDGVDDTAYAAARRYPAVPDEAFSSWEKEARAALCVGLSSAARCFTPPTTDVSSAWGGNGRDVGKHAQQVLHSRAQRHSPYPVDVTVPLRIGGLDASSPSGVGTGVGAEPRFRQATP